MGGGCGKNCVIHVHCCCGGLAQGWALVLRLGRHSVLKRGADAAARGRLGGRDLHLRGQGQWNWGGEGYYSAAAAAAAGCPLCPNPGGVQKCLIVLLNDQCNGALGEDGMHDLELWEAHKPIASGWREGKVL